MQALQWGSRRQRSGQSAGFVPGKPTRPLCLEDAPLQPAARPAAEPGKLRPNNAPEGLGRGSQGQRGGLGGRGGGLRRGGGGGWAGLARSAALEAAQRRRLHHPGLRAGQRRGGRTRVCGEGVLAPAAPGQAPRPGPGGRERPGVETSPGQSAPGGSEGGTDWPVRSGPLLCPPPSLSNPPPLENPPTQCCLPIAPSRPHLSFGGEPSATLALPHPTVAPAPPPSFPRWGKAAPSPRDSGGRARARARPPTSLRSWGPRGDPGRGEAAPGAASLAGSARPGSPLGGWVGEGR